MRDKEAVIIGSGLGGLECGYILAKNGFKVTVLEQNACPGGCLQTFRRRGSDGRVHTFETGLHYVGGLEEGQSLYPFFKYFGLLALPWKKLSEESFDEVVFADSLSNEVRRYSFSSGYDSFTDTLAERFPGQKDNLRRYVSVLKEAGDTIFDCFKDSADMSDMFSVSAYEFLNETITDPLLIKVLSGTSLKMQLDASRLSLYEFAQINNSFIQSAWRLDESDESLIVKTLADAIEKMGGEILTGMEAVSVKIDEYGSAAGVIARKAVPSKMNVNVKANDSPSECFFHADWVISDTHPSETARIMENSGYIGRRWTRRIEGLKNTYGMFTANIILEPGILPFPNRNLYVHREDSDLWHPDISRTESVMLYFYPDADNRYCECMDIISPMPCPDSEKQEGAFSQLRDSDYIRLKNNKLSECIELADKGLSNCFGRGINEMSDVVYTSTPLTWQGYTRTPRGSAYGIVKDCTNPLVTILSPHTPIGNLLMTGQNLNLHGILGVSLTSCLTCSQILGLDTIRKQLGI